MNKSNLIMFLLFTNALLAMDKPMADVSKKRPASEIGQVAPAAKEGRVEQESKNYLFSEYPQDIQQRIRSFLNSAPGFGSEKLYNIAKNIRAQRLVSKQEREQLDDPQFVDLVIRDLATRYSNGNRVKVVLALHTKAAADWLNEQLIKENQFSPFPGKRRLENEVTKELIEQLKLSYIDVALFLLNCAKISHEDRYLLNYNYQNDHEETLLFAAAGAGNIAIFNKMLPFSLAHLNSPNSFGETPLFEAIGRGHTAIALALLRAGASPFALDENNRIEDTALLRASYANNTEVVEELLRNPQVQQRGMNFTTDFFPFPPIECAVQNNNYTIFKALLANPRVKLSGDLLYNALTQDTQMVADLLARGAEGNQEAGEGLRNSFAAFGIVAFSDTGNPLVTDINARDQTSIVASETQCE